MWCYDPVNTEITPNRSAFCQFAIGVICLNYDIDWTQAQQSILRIDLREKFYDLRA